MYTKQKVSNTFIFFNKQLEIRNILYNKVKNHFQNRKLCPKQYSVPDPWQLHWISHELTLFENLPLKWDVPT